MEEPLTPREFLSRYSLPQLVRIHEAHRVSLDSTLSCSSDCCSSITRRHQHQHHQPRSILNSIDSSSVSSSSSASSPTSTLTSDSNLGRSDSSGLGHESSSLAANRTKLCNNNNTKRDEKNNNTNHHPHHNHHHHHNHSHSYNHNHNVNKNVQLINKHHLHPHQHPHQHQPAHHTAIPKHVKGLTYNGKGLVSSRNAHQPLPPALVPAPASALPPQSAPGVRPSVKTISGVKSVHLHNPRDLNNININQPNCDQPDQLDLDQPFLLYKAYTSRQVIGYTVSPDSFDCNYFKKVGPNLLIPEGYRGWFSLVNGKGHTAGYFNSIDEVGRAHVPYFLTRDPIRGFKAPRFAVLAETPARVTSLITTVKGASNYEPITIEGGTVLRFIGVYEDISAFILSQGKGSSSSGKPKSSLRFKKNLPTPLDHGPRYAKCIRFGNIPGGEIVFVPITETGRFYVLAKRSNELSYNHVYSFAQLLRLVKLPVTVQLVTGPRPRNYPNPTAFDPIFQSNLPTNFTAVLRLEEIRVRDVILGCTLRPQTNTLNVTSERSTSALSSIRRTWRGTRTQTVKTEDKPVLLEFDLDSGFSFFRTFVEKNGTLSSRKIPELVIQRVNYCDLEADSWRRQIKLAHDIITKDNHLHNGHQQQQPVIPCYRKSRKSLFDSGVITDHDLSRCCEIDKMASIGSRTSSGVSTVSRLSKIIQKFWSPLKKGSTVSGGSGYRTTANNINNKTDRDFDIGEFEDIEEDINGEDVHSSKIITNNSSIRSKEVVNGQSPKVMSSDQHHHHYETLKKCDEVKYFPPKQKLTRKQTLDVIFTDLDPSSIITDKQSANINNKQIISLTNNCEDEPAYSTIE